MATVKDILAKYKIAGSGADVQRVEAVGPGQAAHVSDSGQDVLVWDRYEGKPVPDAVIAQVKEVRAMLPDPGYKKYAMRGDAGEFMLGGAGIKGCDKTRCVMFTDTKEYKSKLADEIQKQADAIEAARDAESDEGRKLDLHVEWMKTMAYKHLMNGREGPSSAINTYDKAIFTWGMGYGATGVLPRVLSKIYEIEQAKSTDLEDHPVQKLFYLCGFKLDQGHYWVVDVDARKVYKDREPIAAAEYNAFRYIHDTLELHYMWTLAARDDLTRATLLEAQRQIFFLTTGNVSGARRLKTGALYTFLAHLQHWTGDLGMDFVGYAFSNEATPSVSSTAPSEKADGEIAVQAVHRFYKWRSPDWDQNSFGQVRDYWAQMVNEDARDEGATELDPHYGIMTEAPYLDRVPEGSFSGKRHDGLLWSLGPLGDYHRSADGTQTEPSPGKRGKAAPAPTYHYTPSWIQNRLP